MGEQTTKDYKNTRETKVRDFGQKNASKSSKPNSKKPQRPRDGARKRNNSNSKNRQKSNDRKSSGPRPASDNKKAGERKGNNRDRNSNRGKGKAAGNRNKQMGNNFEQASRDKAVSEKRNPSPKPRQAAVENSDKTEQSATPITNANKTLPPMEASSKQVAGNSAEALEHSKQQDLSKLAPIEEQKNTATVDASKPGQAKRKSKSWLEMTASELRQENEHLEEEIEELIESFKTLKL